MQRRILEEAGEAVLPHPAALVIDREGNIAWNRVDTDYRERPPAADLVAAVKALAGD